MSKFFHYPNNEKVPYPPAYTEIYPAVPPSAPDMGWQPPTAETVLVQPPTVYVTQPGIPVTNALLHDQSRMGLYPVKLQPCPHCQTECKTKIKQETTLKTHLFALVLCLMCCCCFAPLPYMTNNATKTTTHFCENCKSYIGSYNRKWCR